MNRLNRFQNFVVRVCRIKKFDVNQALWDKYHEGKQQGFEEGRKEKADCLACTLYQKAQREWQTEQMNRHFQQHPGKYMFYNKDMEQKKFQTRKLRDEPETRILPSPPPEQRL
jgi:hypothetical protein